MSADVNLDHLRQTDYPNEIKRVWELIDPKRPILELRAIQPKGATIVLPPVVRHFRLDEYRDADSRTAAFEKIALELNHRGYNAYAPFNPIRSDFRGPGGARDTDIECRTSMLVDIDRKGDTSRPASEKEVDAARAVARSIRDYLASLEWPSPIAMESGNGFHLYYPLAHLENSDAISAQIKRTLSVLATKFDNDTVGVDRGVYNASRITKIPGTIARKGIESEGRPYRMAIIVDDL
jgi:hypothetical protein